MPVCYLVDNEIGLLVTRYFSSVTKDQVKLAISSASCEAARGRRYKSLAIFDHNVDLSEIDVAALAAIRSAQQSFYRSAGTERDAAAAVVDHSTDAKLVLPLHNALCEIDSSEELAFSLFESLGRALDHLSLPRKVGDTILARTEPGREPRGASTA